MVRHVGDHAPAGEQTEVKLAQSRPARDHVVRRVDVGPGMRAERDRQDVEALGLQARGRSQLRPRVARQIRCRRRRPPRGRRCGGSAPCPSVRAPPDASTRQGSVLAQLAFEHPSMLEFRASSAKGVRMESPGGVTGMYARRSTGLSARSPWSVLIYNINFVSNGLMTLFALLDPGVLPGQRAARIPDRASSWCCRRRWSSRCSRRPCLARRRLRVRQPHARAGDGHDVQLEPDGVVGAVRGVPSAFFAFYGLTPLFRSLGVLTGNQGLIDFGDDLRHRPGRSSPARCRSWRWSRSSRWG